MLPVTKRTTKIAITIGSPLSSCSFNITICVVILNDYFYENFENCRAFLKLQLQNNQVTMTASYIPALFLKILFSKSLTADFFRKLLATYAVAMSYRNCYVHFMNQKIYTSVDLKR